VYLAEQTGEGIRIAVIDSGVHASHPHVRGIAGGIAVREDGTLHEDYVDRLGHGTAVTAAICEKAPNAEILAIKVFWRALSTDIATLVRAIDEAADRGASVINLSLGTARMEYRELLEAAVARREPSSSPPTTMAECVGCRDAWNMWSQSGPTGPASAMRTASSSSKIDPCCRRRPIRAVSRASRASAT
jgi:subtilase family protein